ncbi:hypothetical protein [Actinomadura decatromicini]|uniref:Uncharacterized protein n=1 Tax=Actinomadura decatromicini TaxID=2604572 RepID=A0A5D3F7I3_9ACTN|nr:hypothetical protein [Actinomadura decatromicini]TYK43670.1 hypothetical protein FXF68_36580 [Actinomadura decatromicini]
MASKPLAEVTLADLATKDDLKNLATKDDLAELRRELKQEIGGVRQELKLEIKQEVGTVRQELGSAVNLLMGEIGKMAARQEEMAGHVARLVSKSEGVTH